MKIGVFDSGLGGLLIARSIIQELPDHDCLYLGDTARVPYGTRSKDTIYTFAHQAVGIGSAFVMARRLSLRCDVGGVGLTEIIRRFQFAVPIGTGASAEAEQSE